MNKKFILCTILVWMISPTLWAQCQFNCTGSNTIMGMSAGLNNTASSNSFFGRNAGRTNTSGSSNAFFGESSGYANITGHDNAFFGALAGYNNIDGSNNAFFGKSAGYNNTKGYNNAFFGRSAGYLNDEGVDNAFFGAFAGLFNNGSNNAFFGKNAGYSNTEGYDNAFFGKDAGYSNKTGVRNAFFGKLAGYDNTTGSDNSFFGTHAGLQNTKGSENAFFGVSAGASNKEGMNNAFFGSYAGFFNKTGNDNAFFGKDAGRSNDIGFNNAVFGAFAGQANTSGTDNVFFGKDAGFYNITGNGNVFLGSHAGRTNSTGSNNTMVGRRAGRLSTKGNGNIFLGYESGYSNKEGEKNVFLGYQAGYSEEGAHKLYIANDKTSTPLIYGEFDNKILNVNGSLGIGIKNPERPIHLRATNAIFRIDRDRDDPGFAIVRYDSGFKNVWKSFYFYTRGNGPNEGKFVIADWGTQVAGPSTPRLVIANNGNVGIGNYLNSNPSQKLTISGNALANNYYTSSDQRFKKDIQTISGAMQGLEKIQGVSYAFDTQKFADRNLATGKTLGLIAQEVQKVYPELVAEDAEGYLSVNYDGLIPVLIEALKEQKTMIEEQKNALEKQKAYFEERLASLTLQSQQQSGQHSTQIQTLPKLYQNQPNPFDQITEIKMFLPDEVKQATLYIYNMQGQTVKQVLINQRGETSVEISGNTLSSGMYLYALIADQEEVDVKRMIIK